MRARRILNELSDEIDRLEDELEYTHYMIDALEVVLDRWGTYEGLSYKERKICIELEIIHRAKTGLTYVEIADKYDVSRETVLKRRRRLISEGKL